MLFANLGAVQLNYGVRVDDARRLVDALDANGLYLHLNPLQEAIQPGGDTNFRALEPKIAALCAALDVPVIAKSVGSGIAPSTAARLLDCGVAAIDVARRGRHVVGAGRGQTLRRREPRAHRRSVRRLGLRDAARDGVALRAALPAVPLDRQRRDPRRRARGARRSRSAPISRGLALPFLRAADESDAAVADADRRARDGAAHRGVRHAARARSPACARRSLSAWRAEPRRAADLHLVASHAHVERIHGGVVAERHRAVGQLEASTRATGT